jgi:crotonobetainyl-CoA:carnitine CoA-transferase CaiB-like acyl-CoA transferase
MSMPSASSKRQASSAAIVSSAEETSLRDTTAPTASAGPLAGIRVREFSGSPTVGACCRILGDLGATVESDGVLDQAPPTPVGLPALMEAYNRRGKVPVHSPLEDFDIVVLDKTQLARQRAELETLIEQGTVVVVLSPFGLTGPRADWLGNDLVTQSYGGGTIRNGDPDRAPLRSPVGLGDQETGIGAAAAALIAWLGTRRGCGGQLVDVSSVEAWAVLQTGTSILEFLFQDRREQRQGRRYLGRGYPHTILRTGDGDARLICVQGREWARALEMMGSPAWGRDERYASRMRNQERYADELDGLVGEWLSHRTGDDLLRKALDHQLPWVPIRRPSEVLTEPQLHARGYVREHGARELSVGYPVQFSRTPVGTGHHHDQDPPPLARSSTLREAKGLPLEGIRVLDFSWAWAGGLVGAVLADFGAEVIKVESRRRLDPMRMDRPLIGEDQDVEQGSLHHNVNRGKKSILVDITTPEGAELVAQLAEQVDVVVENFSTGVMEKRGLGYAALAARNPRLIYLSSSATGSTGPLVGLRAYAPVLTALAGVDSMVGYEGEDVRGMQHSLADPNAALHGVVAVLAAVIERESSGRGQYLDLSQLEALIDLIAPVLFAAQDSEDDFTCLGNSDPTALFSDVVASAGDGGYVAIACETAEQLRALTEVVGHTGGDDLATSVTEWTCKRDKWDAANELQAAGVPAGPVLDIGERFGDDHLHARGAFVAAEHPVVGAEFLCGIAWHLSKTPGEVRASAPLLGADTAEIFGRLGLSGEEIDQLEEQGVLG